MTEKKIFLQFIQSEASTSQEFEAARKYVIQASLDEKKLFLDKIDAIIHLVLQNMIEKHVYDFHYFREIYQRYGLFDLYFQHVFQLYLYRYQKDDLVNQYFNRQECRESIIFAAAKTVLWNRKDLAKIAKRYHISYDRLKQIITEYAQKEYHLTNNFKDYRTCYRAFRRFLDQHDHELNTKENAYTYYNVYALLPEKDEFQRVVQQYFNQIIHLIHDEAAINHFLEKHHLTDYDLYYFTMIIPNLDASVQLQIFTRFKKYYDLCLDGRFITKNLREKSNSLGMYPQHLIQLGTIYAKEVLKNEHIEKEIAQYRIRRVYTKKAYSILDRVAKETDPIKIYEELAATQIDLGDVYIYCYAIRQDLEKKEQQKLEQKLLKDLKNYHDRNCQRNHSNDYLLYQKYLQGTDDFQTFCEKNGKNVIYFRRKASDLNNPYAQEVQVRIKKEAQEKSELQILLCEELYQSIRDGIMVNGIHRDFTLVDYFYYFGNLQIHKMRYHIMNLADPIKTTLCKFFKPLRFVNNVHVEAIRKSIYEYDSLKDENGFPIKGTGKILTGEELNEVIQFFQENQIPLYDKLVAIALKCHANHSLYEKNTLQRK